ncbi:Na+/H+ antiporter NhaC [Oscillospiraceae bacterium 50-60]
MSTQSPKRVKPWQALLMLAVGIAVIIAGLLVLKVNNRIVLALDGVIMCVMAVCFGIPYGELQKGVKDTIASMIVAMLILLVVGVLVGTWMASGTVPVMIYWGMKIITPGLFLPITCILCTFMSTLAGTSWGTLATVGIACMGVAQGLGVPLPAAAGAVVVGAFFGDKISPLSDSPVITSTVCDVPMMEGIKHALISTGPAYLVSLVFFLIYGLRFSGGTVGGEVYEDILSTVSGNFSLNLLMLIPVVVVIVLIVLQKPTLPTFIAGIAVGAVLAMVFQGMGLTELLNTMYSGYSISSGSEVVDSMLNRGGFTSMLSTIGLLMAAGIFGAPLRTAGVVDVLLDFVRKVAKNSRTMATGVMLLHALFFCITGAYYVTYPVIGDMTKDMFPEYGLDRKNLMRTMLDTGTGLAPLVPWSTTGSYTATTLGVANIGFAAFAPMLWLSIVLSFIYNLTGIGVAKLKEQAETKD